MAALGPGMVKEPWPGWEPRQAPAVGGAGRRTQSVAPNEHQLLSGPPCRGAAWTSRRRAWPREELLKATNRTARPKTQTGDRPR
ncbi:hypothetical protein E2562_036447 [Oryza meyeriana var. granulata]|uniref:Uncharacterized protein n=1 Tax=Oryza meyeriana var. granulata TaxID=110450 RepID=A0A6G1DAP7_9ORYZ|nr:hypothetical protein E2562_036447 [Oryza meyeriana var. granulata]